MVAKELLLLFLFCGVTFTSAVLEKRAQRLQCREKTLFCPCKDKRGRTGHVLLVTCRDENDPNISLCRGKALYSEECGKVNFSPKRHRRDTGNCMNGIIPGSPHTSDKDPQAIMISGSNIIRKLDDTPTFKCQVHSNFSANVTWLFNGKPLEKKGKYTFASCKRNLQVKHMSKSDAGNYTCVVTNEKGKQASALAKLDVNARSPPSVEFVGLEQGNTAFIGTTVNITCKIQGLGPLVNGFFLKNGTQLHEDSKQLKYIYFHSKKNNISHDRRVTLEIKNITMKDAGIYMCEVIRDGLTSSETFRLKVGPCPAGSYCPPGGSGPIKCPEGTYQPNISQTSEQACKPCPAGFYCPLGVPGPIQCPLGTYQPKMNQTSRHICRQCTAGFYCPPGGSSRIQCPQGTYQPNISQTSEQACKPCPFFTNLSKNQSSEGPILDEAHCPGEDPIKETITSAGVTKTVIGMASGVVIIIIVVVLLLFVAKKKRLLWFSSLRHRHDPECYTCQPILNGDAENAEGAEILKTLPEIDYEAKHDVFICYCYKDVDWVKELLAELEGRGFECCIDFKTFTIGEAIVQNIAEAICFSKKTIAVLSPDFIKSDWCRDELHKALSRVRYHQVVPVMYKNCEIPFALRDTTYLDWENCNVKPYFWEQLEKALRKPNGEAYVSRRLKNGNQTSEVSARV